MKNSRPTLCPSDPLLVLLVAMLTALAAAARAASLAGKPNIIIVLSDDVGYGDIGCYGATRVKTPNLDRLAAAGLRFTDAHSSAATCTPSRYSLLTGVYAFRKKGTGILPGDAALVIDPARVTVPSMLKRAGYVTGCVGKWHLGLGNGNLDWNTEIKPGPCELGFDYAFIIPATGDRVPCVFVENHRVVGLDPKDPIQVSYGKPIGNEPTGAKNPELLKLKPSHGHDNTIVNGISRIGYMSGGMAARWKDEEIADLLAHKATAFIEQHQDKPFFLYFATHDIHVPRVPHPRYSGSSQCGVRGDVIQQLDGCVGEVMATLDRLKLADNTLLIFSSDNGPVVDDGYADGASETLNGHKPAGPFRGGKYSIFEGGTRMPFLVRWPGRIKPGTSAALVCQVDFLASFAALVGQNLPAEAGPDSVNVLAALLGQPGEKGRENLVEHANGVALRKGPWKFIPEGPKPAWKKVEPGDKRPRAGGPNGAQLYNLQDDVAESSNLAAARPEIVDELSALLEKVKQHGTADERR
jgi:arylsulfatase A-like enzyme